MIKDISTLLEKSYRERKRFFSNCTIQEKISAFYLHVKIVSSTVVKFYKRNYEEIAIEDMILNKMWMTPVKELTKVFLENPKFVEDHIGFTFSFFFMPVSKPFNIDYANDTGWKYLLSFIKDGAGNVHSLENSSIYSLSSLIRNHSHLLLNSLRSKSELEEIATVCKSDSLQDYVNLVKDLIDVDDLATSDKNFEAPEGYILRDKDEVYQIVNHQDIQGHDSIIDNRLALEFFTQSFSSYLSLYNYQDCVVEDYVKTVCHLLLDYKHYKYEQDGDKEKFKFYGINPNDLKAPFYGYYDGTGYEFIPIKEVRDLCKNDVLFENIFKILINGLKRYKKYNKNSLLVTKKNIDAWNEAVGFISNYTKVKI